MEAMKVFENATSTKPTTMAGASVDNDLPTTTLFLDDDEDVLRDKVGRNVTMNVNVNATLPTVTTNAVQCTIPTRNAVRTGMAPALARHVQFQETDIQRLMCELWAFYFGGVPEMAETTQPEAIEASKTTEPIESMNLAFDHAMELLCFTMEISLDPRLPKMLREALSRRDMEKWKEALASKILNFLK